MKYIPSILGLVLTLTALWLGSYLMYLYPIGTWQNFPLVLTTYFSFVGGLAVAIFKFPLGKHEWLR